nr:FTR1 family protein [Pleurocapsa sp. PCC 7327]
MMNLSAALPTFVVTLREGFEAALVVGIVLACLSKAHQTQLNRWVYQGIGGGMVASVMVGFLLAGVLQEINSHQSPYTPVIREVLAGVFGLVAIAMLSWMLIWMTQQAKSVKSDVEGAIQTALAQNDSAGKAIFLLVFIAVLREGFETVLFILAKFQEGFILPATGAITGLLVAAGLGILLFKWGVKINIRLFFQVMGILLLLIVGGLVIGMLKHVDASVALLMQIDWRFANWCIVPGESCLLGPLVWDTSEFLPDREFPGIILKSLFGYRQKLYLGQAIAYLLFMGLVGGAYFQSLTGRSVLGKNSEKTVEKAS